MKNILGVIAVICLPILAIGAPTLTIDGVEYYLAQEKADKSEKYDTFFGYCVRGGWVAPGNLSTRITNHSPLIILDMEGNVVKTIKENDYDYWVVIRIEADLHIVSVVVQRGIVTRVGDVDVHGYTGTW